MAEDLRQLRFQLDVLRSLIERGVGAIGAAERARRGYIEIAFVELLDVQTEATGKLPTTPTMTAMPAVDVTGPSTSP